MTDRVQGVLTTVTKVISIVVIFVGIITYISGVGMQVQSNSKSIERNTLAIVESQRSDVAIQMQLREIETHLVYIRKALDE